MGSGAIGSGRDAVMDRRTLLALAVALILLGLYPFVLEKFYPGYMNSSATTPSSTVSPSSSADSFPVSADTGEIRRDFVPATALSAAAPEDFLKEHDVIFRTERLDLVFNRKDASIRRIGFPAFTDPGTKRPLEFLSLEKSGNAPTSLRILDSGLGLGEAAWNYKVERLPKGRQQGVFAFYAAPGIRVTKKYFFSDEKYDGQLNILIENTSDKPLEFRYRLFAGSSLLPRNSIDSQYIEANFYSNHGRKEPLRHLKETKPGKLVQSDAPVDWVAIKDRHFSVVLKPKSEGNFTGLVEGLGKDQFSVSVLSEKISIPPRGSVTQDFLLYMGPNELPSLMPVGLDPIINFGKLDIIGKGLVGVLEILQKIFRNYGLSIIALTTLINIFLLPLTHMSYMSMKRMQHVQPHVTKLKEQHKKNPEKLNKEMMELYKKHKVNPFGGCLPMLLQMPVFIALYVALSKSVILINAKFLWIRDLSSPDRVPLPFSLPFLGNEIHALPLIMVGAMAIQQKASQPSAQNQDPNMAAQQKMMAVMMPLVFGFIFYTMPSGLVLYWLTNTILMTLYQLRLKRIVLA
jgi:YidC/Oxa1 family membrane protein insertase